MKLSSIVPRLHVFVCANRREVDSPLGSGCGAAGEEVFARFKDEVARRSAYRTSWITRTQCLGLCPQRGAAVAVYPVQRLFTEVEPDDVATLFETALEEQKKPG